MREYTAPVSVVIPCYRCSETIRQAVASVARQTLPPREVIVVDDGSNDHTSMVLQEILGEYPRDWIHVITLESNRGPSSARNRGWDIARQQYVAFLDADDSWHPRKLELQIRTFRADPLLSLLGHPMDVRQVGAPACPVEEPVRVELVRPRTLLFRNLFPTPSVVLQRDIPFRFNERYRRAEDYLLWAQVAFSGYRCARLDRSLAFLHKPPFGGGGLSADLDAMNRAGFRARGELHELGLITRPQLYASHLVASLRHARRLLLTWIRKRGRQ